MTRRIALVLVLALAACSDTAGGEVENPFLVDQENAGKEDTMYLNPDGIEVEVDLEADVQAPASRIEDAPAVLGQFALTYLRNRGDFYLESLAEDAGSADRVEWKVDGVWITADKAKDVAGDKLTHFRIRGVNAVLLNSAKTGAKEGKVYTAKVPLKPFSLMSDVGDKCATKDNHISLDQSVYWYLWNPSKSGCNAQVQDMTITISKMLPVPKVVYPEYDRLVEDGKVTAVLLFGQIDDGAITEDEPGMIAMAQMAEWLAAAKFKEGTATIGRRFTKKIGAYDVVIDLYSPKDFAGLGDMAHFGNFQKALSEHEIVAYDGHSMLGASDFWSKPDYPQGYQIYLYGGCLGYEYYVRPIVGGKGGWQNVDILSSVVEVSANANEFAAPALAKIFWALGHGLKTSWKDILLAVRKSVGDSTFGVSGVRGNCYTPAGSVCGASSDKTKLYEDAPKAKIPDNDEAGIVRAIDVPDSFVATSVAVDLEVTHTWIGDLRIVLEHDGVEAVVWDNAGGNGSGIRQAVAATKFKGTQVKGRWTLTVVDSEKADVGTLDRWALVLGQP
jgi:hypothetical protein